MIFIYFKYEKKSHLLHHTKQVFREMIEQLKQIIKNFLQKCRTYLDFNKLALALVGCLLLLKKYISNKQVIPEIPMSQFLNEMKKGGFTQARVTSDSIFAMTKNNQLVQVSHSLMPKNILFNLLQKSKISFFYEKPTFGSLEVFLISFLLSAIGTFLYISMSKSNVKKSKPEAAVKFRDIIGLNEAKLSLLQVIQYMFSKEKYEKIGARMRKGILLYGPSGTGKTTLAKACANQANVPFFSCNAAEFCEIYVGMGPKKIRDLFEKAKSSSPSIIYIDEIDAIGSRVHGGLFENSNSEKNSTINQLLSQMDGFDSSSNILVIGSTNRVEMVDPALLRAGRFDLKLKIPLPNCEDRISIMKLHLQKKNHNLSDEFIESIMVEKNGWSGAEIQNLTNEAVYHSLRRKGEKIEERDILSILNIGKSRILEQEQME